MIFFPPQRKPRKGRGRVWVISNRSRIVPANFASWFATRPKFWVQAIPRLAALLLAGCSEKRAATADLPKPVTPAIEPSSTDISIRPTPDDPTTAPPPIDPAPSPETAADPGAVERRYLAAAHDPATRIAAIRELANANPAASLALLNRVFPLERREDVKSEMLTVLGDLDHSRDRDPQLALCAKALASSQPQRVRYIAIHTMADLHDPRARAFLLPLQNDPDREIRNAAAQVLAGLEKD